MKVKEKKALLRLFEEQKYDEAREYILNCEKDHTSNRETANERNLKWAMGNREALDMLNIEVGETKRGMVARGTLSCVATYVYPDRNYRFLTVKEDGSCVVVRIK